MRGLEEPIQVDEGDAGIIEQAMATVLLVIDDSDKANLASRLKRRWPCSVLLTRESTVALKALSEPFERRHNRCLLVSRRRC